MKKVLTVGVFDYFHYGHYKLFENAKKIGDYLIVAVQDGDYILKYKPNTDIIYSTKQRVELVSALKLVDETIIYYDVDKIVQQVDFDIFAVGEDQNHSGFQKAISWCQSHSKQVVHLPRTSGISSSQLKKNILNN